MVMDNKHKLFTEHMINQKLSLRWGKSYFMRTFTNARVETWTVDEEESEGTLYYVDVG
jgi:hypothetical protein